MQTRTHRRTLGQQRTRFYRLGIRAPRMSPLAPVRWAALVAALGGIAGAFAFPRVGIWPLAIVSVACLSWAVEGRTASRGAWLGFVYGVAFFAPLLHWTGIYVGPVPWLLLAVAEAAFMALLGAVLALVQRLPAAPFWIGCAWVLQEALRDRLPFGGFPWGRLAFSQENSPLRWFIKLGGAPLLSFAVALTGGAFAYTLTRLQAPAPLQRRHVLAGIAVLIAVPLCAAGYGAIDGPASGGDALKVALVQGSVPDRGLAFEDRARQVLDNHVAQTLKLAVAIDAGTVARPDLVVWPENSSDVDPLTDDSAAAEIDRAVKAVGAPVLVGAILNGPHNTRLNAGILWSPTTGPGAEYIKRHPVPFAEYIPLRSIADKVSSAAKLVTQDMAAGTGDGLLRGGPVLLGDVICFEVAYDNLVQSSVDAGAKLLVVQTNNATFGHTSETYQQVAMSRLRAIETDRTVLQVSTTGVSAIIAPDGSVTMQSGALFQPAVLSSGVALSSSRTLAVRVGSVPEMVLAACALLGAAWAVLRRRRPAKPYDRLPEHEEMVMSDAGEANVSAQFAKPRTGARSGSSAASGRGDGR